MEEINQEKEHSFISKEYDDFYSKSIHEESMRGFWHEESKEVFWYKSPKEENVLKCEKAPFYTWFSDATTNMTFNCLDRHVNDGLGKNNCIIHESAYTNKSTTITYEEALLHVGKLAWVMKNRIGVKKGDRVIIYMPMIPEGLLSMLACARIGAIHSVVFGGFAANELANRIDDSEPTLIITASVGIEPRKKIPYYPIVKEALKGKSISILLLQRSEYIEKELLNEITFDYAQEIDAAKNVEECVEIPSNDPLYILYTSGTTGSPKGIVRDTGGTCVAANCTGKYVLDLNPGDVTFSTSDIGWVVGHTYIVYAPLIRGCTTMIFEGKPVGTPDCGVIWRLIDKWKVKSFYTAPTALRAIKKEDHDCSILKKSSLKELTGIHLAGERCDPDTIDWLKMGIPSRILLNDSWWQTETGHHISGNNLKIYRFPTVPGSATRPLPGFNVQIMEEKTWKVIQEPEKSGMIVIKLPMPPSFMTTLWGNDQAFIEKYISPDLQFYITGDAGHFDKNGYLNIMTRLDDIIKVAGHRLSTGRIEEVIDYHPQVVESAVVGMNDSFKMEVPFAFIVVEDGIETEELIQKVIKEVKERVVNEIGAIARLSNAIVVNKLPKTRSGKILRRILKQILNKEKFTIPPTIDDVNTIDEIVNLLNQLGV